MAAAGTPVVFVHGLWLHATSWQPWMDLFSEAGYAPVAPGWPGEPETVEAARATPESVAGYGINDVVEHYAAVIGGLHTKPVVIGHSFGGLIAQRLLAQEVAAAAVAIDAAPIKGVLVLPPSALRVASVALRNPLNRGKSVSLTEKQFRYGFGSAISAMESTELYRKWAIPSPGKPLFEAAAANFFPHSPAKVDTATSARGPLLLIAGGSDHAVPASVTRQTRKLYRKSTAVTDYQEFTGKGHSLAVDSGWREVAAASLAWVKDHT
jgi:alpha-beta hydrolase superfamily lysophospholipase